MRVRLSSKRHRRRSKKRLASTYSEISKRLFLLSRVRRK
jgi:hypothetical protein